MPRDQRLTSRVGKLRHPFYRTKLWGYRPKAIVYWESLCYFLGGVFFTESSFVAMSAAVTESKTLTYTLNYVFQTIGATFFTIGTYLGVLAVVNSDRVSKIKHWRENSGENSAQHANDTFEYLGARQLRYWGWMPRRLDYWGQLIMFLGAVIFQVNVENLFIGAEPGSKLMNLTVWMPSTIGEC